MRAIISLLLFLLSLRITFSQKPKYETVEMKGEILNITSGSGFTFSELNIKQNGKDTAYFQFPPEYGELILHNFKPGGEIELRARILQNTPSNHKKIAAMYHFQDEIMAVKVIDKWVDLANHRWSTKAVSKVFIEKVVKDEFLNGKSKLAFLIDEGVVAFMNPVFISKNEMPNIKIGDAISFIGYEYPVRSGYVYPKWKPNGVYTFSPLSKAQGTIKSYLYKQNYVLIGLVLETNLGELKLSFPSDMGRQVKQFLEQHPSVSAYHSKFEFKDQLNPPELHALISERDTLRIDKIGFYGGADGSHDHKLAEIEGKISSVNRSDKGKIMSVILGNDCYIEVDYNMEKQLAAYLKKGKTIKVSGQERIKNAGEIYSKEYRIITPSEITTDGKVFLVNMLPE